MASTETLLDDPELNDAEWDLAPLASDDAEVLSQLEDADRRAASFAGRYAGKVPELDGAQLVEAMRELSDIEDLAGRAGSYASLRFSTDTAEPERGALLQKVQELGTAIETKLLFFGLEWAVLDDAKAEELLGAEGLDFARHHLRM